MSHNIAKDPHTLLTNEEKNHFNQERLTLFNERISMANELFGSSPPYGERMCDRKHAMLFIFSFSHLLADKLGDFV